MKWSERTIAAALAQQTFNRKYLVVVPNCNWTGYEADILSVTENLRLIDVEIKISRADLRADARKSKWWHSQYVGQPRRVDEFNAAGRLVRSRRLYAQQFELRTWPRRVWKHYYALPAEIWTDDLLPSLGSAASGVLLLTEDAAGLRITCRRPAKPCSDADKLTPAAAVYLARLASLRMWDAYKMVDALRARQEGGMR